MKTERTATMVVLAVAGLLVAAGLGVAAGKLTDPAVGLTEEPRSISRDLVHRPPRHLRPQRPRDSREGRSRPPIADARGPSAAARGDEPLGRVTSGDAPESPPAAAPEVSDTGSDRAVEEPVEREDVQEVEREDVQEVEREDVQEVEREEPGDD